MPITGTAALGWLRNTELASDHVAGTSWLLVVAADFVATAATPAAPPAADAAVELILLIGVALAMKLILLLRFNCL